DPCAGGAAWGAADCLAAGSIATWLTAERFNARPLTLRPARAALGPSLLPGAGSRVPVRGDGADPKAGVLPRQPHLFRGRGAGRAVAGLRPGQRLGCSPVAHGEFSGRVSELLGIGVASRGLPLRFRLP